MVVLVEMASGMSGAPWVPRGKRGHPGGCQLWPRDHLLGTGARACVYVCVRTHASIWSLVWAPWAGCGRYTHGLGSRFVLTSRPEGAPVGGIGLQMPRSVHAGVSQQSDPVAASGSPTSVSDTALALCWVPREIAVWPVVSRPSLPLGAACYLVGVEAPCLSSPLATRLPAQLLHQIRNTSGLSP